MNPAELQTLLERANQAKVVFDAALAALGEVATELQAVLDESREKLGLPELSLSTSHGEIKVDLLAVADDVFKRGPHQV